MVSVYNTDYNFQPFSATLVNSNRYTENYYSFCSPKTIAAQNCATCPRHFKPLGLNRLALQKCEYLATYIVYICAFRSGLGTSKGGNMTSMGEVCPLQTITFRLTVPRLMING